VIVLGVLWLLTLWWAKKSWVAWLTILLVAALIVVSFQRSAPRSADAKVCWLVEDSIALRFFILFIGVMSCLYSVWDIIDVSCCQPKWMSSCTGYSREESQLLGR